MSGRKLVGTKEELRELLGEVSPRVAGKDRLTLHALDREWLAASPLVLVATSASDGTCDVSPKGDPPGFVHVIDDKTIAIPERPGNRRADSFHNVLENPHVGLIVMIPGRGDTLRINGRASLVRDASFFDELIVKGHRPILALVVDIEQVFYHCSKAFMRSKLWKPEGWTPDAVPPRAEIAHQMERSDQDIEEVRAHYSAGYADKLYKS